MANPLVPQGSLNRLRASVVFAAFPNLNVTASYLAPEGIVVTLENDAGQLLPTMTGGVTSPEPYQMANVQLHILKSQSLAATYKTQIEALCNVGDVTVISDASTLPDYQLINCVLLGVSELNFNGTVVGYVVRMKGIYYVNSSLYNIT